MAFQAAHRRLAPLLTASLIAASACAAPTATPTRTPPASPAASSAASPGPSPSPPIPGLSWMKADVARPDAAFAEPSAVPSGPSGPGTAGHPGHFPGQAIVDDVVATPDGLFAVGYVGIDGIWTAIDWRSSDGRQWTVEPIDPAPASFAVGVAAAKGRTDGSVFAAGRSGPKPVVWAHAGRGSWNRVELPTLSHGAEWERAVAIAGTDDAVLVGGSVGPELGTRRARFWRSTESSVWEAVPDGDAFGGAEVVAIEPHGRRGFVALAHLGTGQRGTGSIALLSDDGVTWRRVDDAALATGLANGLATDAEGALVAVGSDLDEREALVWRSTDGGASWQQAPGEPSRLYEPYKIRMTDVVSTPGGLVAVGNYVGLQYGTATSWVASDWEHWTRAANYPALGQGEMLAIAPGGPGLVATGSFGAPDNYVPTIWLSEAPGG
jgi:hypothetical protein